MILIQVCWSKGGSTYYIQVFWFGRNVTVSRLRKITAPSNLAHCMYEFESPVLES